MASGRVAEAAVFGDFVAEGFGGDAEGGGGGRFVALALVEALQDHATFDRPHQYATGVTHVFVNGTQVLKNGKHTGERPGRVVRGPGWKKK